MDLNSLLAWDDAGPVAILFFMLVCLTILARWLLVQLIKDKDTQIQRLFEMNTDLSKETAATLAQILQAVRERNQR